MRTIYIDSEYMCHVSADGIIEGYRFVPAGQSWTRSDGRVFHGEMIAPWKPYGELAAAQAQYKTDQAELAAAYQEGVNSV